MSVTVKTADNGRRYAEKDEVIRAAIAYVAAHKGHPPDCDCDPCYAEKFLRGCESCGAELGERHAKFCGASVNQF